MLKGVLIFILGLLIFREVDAQKKQSGRDTLLYYMKDSGEVVDVKDSADYFLLIMPADNSLGTKAYPVTEIYPNGKRKLIGYSLYKSYRLTFQGARMTFFPNGHKESIMTYDHGSPTDNAIKYYPNGKLWNVTKYNKKVVSLMECRDSTGKVLAENGNGMWVDFDDDFKHRIAEGQISNGLEEGEWHGNLSDTSKFICTYKAGNVVTGTGYDKSGKEHPFTKVNLQPEFKSGLDGFGRYLAQNIRYPTEERSNNITGKVMVQFVIEKNGTLTDIKAVSSPSEGLAMEAFRVMLSSPAWKPGYRYGMPVRIAYIVPIVFALSGN